MAEGGSSSVEADPSRPRQYLNHTSPELSDYSDADSDFDRDYDADSGQNEDNEDKRRPGPASFANGEQGCIRDDVGDKGKRRAHGINRPNLPPSPTRSRTESYSGHAVQSAESRTWRDLNLSIVVALISPIGNWLTGSDHIKHLCLLLLLIFYLHQLIEVPWQLYHKSRTHPSVAKKLRKGIDEVKDATHHAAQLAHSELKGLELFYLGLSIFAPFIGAHLIRHIFMAMEVDSLSWFSQTLFVLATGVRPWSHFIERLQQRTNDLQDVVDQPVNEERHRAVDQTLAAIMARLDSLEEALHNITDKSEQIEPLQEACEDLTEAMGDLERSVHRHERKTELARVAHNTRLAVLETGLQHLEEREHYDAAATTRIARHAMTTAVQEKSHSILSQFFTRLWAFFHGAREAVLARLPSYMLKERPKLRTRHSSGTPPLSPSASSSALLSSSITSSISSTTMGSVPHFNGTPLETIPEDSDSEGTYVSENTPLSPPSVSVKLTDSGRAGSKSRSRSRSFSDPRKPVDLSQPSTAYGNKAIVMAATVAGWPYHFAAGVLGAMMPGPLRKA